MVRAICLDVLDYFWNFLFNTVILFWFIWVLHFMAVVSNNNSSNIFFNIPVESLVQPLVQMQIHLETTDLKNGIRTLQNGFQEPLKARHNPLFSPGSEHCLLWNTWLRPSGQRMGPRRHHTLAHSWAFAYAWNALDLRGLWWISRHLLKVCI